MNAEQQKLCAAVDWFAEQMKAKLCDKERCGWGGWRQKRYHESGRCLRQLQSHVARLTEGLPQEVDIANLAMFMAFYQNSVNEARNKNMKIIEELQEAFAPCDSPGQKVEVSGDLLADAVDVIIELRDKVRARAATIAWLRAESEQLRDGLAEFPCCSCRGTGEQIADTGRHVVSCDVCDGSGKCPDATELLDDTHQSAEAARDDAKPEGKA